MSDKALKQLLEVAAGVSERAADETGFVRLASLAREVQADVKFRPLLVEGVAAQPKSKDGRWLILIDSETHTGSDELLAAESVTRPLGARVRNTVAHELAHALGPRCEEVMGSGEKTRAEIVAMLERETERLSPALLIPRRALEGLVKSRQEPLDLPELIAARDRWGVSARVFVMRLELLAHEQENGLRHHPRLDNVVIGSGEWLKADQPDFHLMPFRGVGGLSPEFVALLRSRKRVAVGEHFTSPDFYLNGGSETTSVATLWLGTSGALRSEQGQVQILVESVPRKAGQAFLWMARRIDG